MFSKKEVITTRGICFEICENLNHPEMLRKFAVSENPEFLAQRS